MKINNKRGVIFTVATIILGLSLFIFAKAHIETAGSVQSSLVSQFNGDIIRYFFDDIGADVFSDLMGTSVEKITNDDTSVIFYFNQTLSSIVNDPNSLLATYETYIETTYPSNNHNFTLTRFNNTLYMDTYGARYSMDNRTLLVYTGDTANLVNITVEIQVDETSAVNTTSQPDDDGGDASFVPIIVRYLRPNGTVIQEWTSLEQNPTESNSPFRQTFVNESTPDVTEINVAFGNYGGQDGVLRIWLDAISGYDIRGNTTRLELAYNDISGKKDVTGGNLTITAQILNITKEAPIILGHD